MHNEGLEIKISHGNIPFSSFDHLYANRLNLPHCF